MYCTASEVRDLLLGETPADSDDMEYVGTGAEMETEYIEREIVNAQSQIDAVLGKKYTVPFDPVPDLIKQICIDISGYLVDLAYRKSREYESQNYPIIFRYNRAKEMLEFLRTGAMVLPTDTVRNEGGAYVVNRYWPQLFSAEDIFRPKPSDW